MRRIAYFLLVTNLLWAGGFLLTPLPVLAAKGGIPGPPASTPASNSSASPSSSSSSSPGQSGEAGDKPQKSEAPAASVVPPKVDFSRSLESGTRGGDVKGMQQVLGQFPDLAPFSQNDGEFGILTELAVRNLQNKFGITKESGSVGPERSEEHTSKLQSQFHLVCRLVL